MNLQESTEMAGVTWRVFSRICQKQILSEELQKYNEAIKALNALQSNASVIQEARNRQAMGNNQRTNNVETTLKYVKRLGLAVDELEPRVIHISGTKGKGSTAHMTEALLRATPYRTGLFQSPHIISVRERIMINGKPLSPKLFAYYFWAVYNTLLQNRENCSDMPSYFKFLTLLALKVFISEKVDVAVLEVGIGGELDCTNIFKHTPVVGICSIGLDHTKLLGNSLEKIAWEKAGIMKPGCRAFTVPDQSPSVIDVFHGRAAEKQCTIEIVPHLSEYPWDSGSFSYPQQLNGSLAIQLAKAWSLWNNYKQHLEYPRLRVTNREESILSNCSIPGRCYLFKENNSNVQYCLDGAHTVESMEVAKHWFKKTSPKDSLRLLVFNVTGGRCSKPLLQLLLDCGFSEAVFCTNCISDNEKVFPEDLVDHSISREDALRKAEENLKVWEGLGGTTGRVVSSVSEAILLIESKARDPVSVLITGSLHLVGSAYFLLKPNLYGF